MTTKNNGFKPRSMKDTKSGDPKNDNTKEKLGLGLEHRYIAIREYLCTRIPS